MWRINCAPSPSPSPAADRLVEKARRRRARARRPRFAGPRHGTVVSLVSAFSFQERGHVRRECLLGWRKRPGYGDRKAPYFLKSCFKKLTMPSFDLEHGFRWACLQPDRCYCPLCLYVSALREHSMQWSQNVAWTSKNCLYTLSGTSLF
jgi:hypothetical protein